MEKSTEMINHEVQEIKDACEELFFTAGKEADQEGAYYFLKDDLGLEDVFKKLSTEDIMQIIAVFVGFAKARMIHYGVSGFLGQAGRAIVLKAEAEGKSVEQAIEESFPAAKESFLNAKSEDGLTVDEKALVARAKHDSND